MDGRLSSLVAVKTARSALLLAGYCSLTRREMLESIEKIKYLWTCDESRCVSSPRERSQDASRGGTLNGGMVKFAPHGAYEAGGVEFSDAEGR